MPTTINISTRSRETMTDITHQIRQAANDHNWQNGILTVFTPHTTAAITINENADPDVTSDMIRFLNKQIPQHDDFRHYEGNSDAHLKSSFFGCSEQVIIEEGSLVLGTWQGIYFCDFDGPRPRKVYLKFIG